MILDQIKTRLIKLMWIGKKFETDNGNWRVEVVRSALPGFLSGRVISNRSGQRYVFSVRNGKVSYMREYKPPQNIPNYLTDFILHIQDSLKDRKAEDVDTRS